MGAPFGREGGKYVGSVYVVRCQEYYKIGRSTVPYERAKQIQVDSPHPVELIHVMPNQNRLRAEKYLHHRFATHRHAGEWFALPDDAVAWLRGVGDIDQVVRDAGFLV